MLYFLFFLTIFGISFAFCESAVVVYLRKLYYIDNVLFPLKEMPKNILIVEVLREFSTLVILFSSSVVIGKLRQNRIATFFYLFGVWDIFYYIFLYFLIKWPKSLFDWDILFLIPFPWISPVYAPLLCSISFITFSILIFYFTNEGYPIPILFKDFILFFISVFLILLSFFSQTSKVLNNQIPEKFPNLLFFLGFILLNLTFIIKFIKIYLKYSNNKRLI